MKKLLLTFLFFATVSSFAQIRLVNTTKTEILSRIGLVYIEKVDEGKSFVVNFSNMNSPIIEYKSFSFKNTDNAFNTLYEIMMQGFNEVPRDPYKIQAGEGFIYLKYLRVDGNVLMQIQQFLDTEREDGSREMAVSKHLTEDDIKMLFKK